MYMPRSLNTMLDPIAKQAIGKDWGIYATLLDRWQEIVGPDYAKVTSPAKITFPHQPNEPRRKGGTLTIRLPKGLAMEFTYKVDIIRQRVNNYFGYEAFAKITLDTVQLLPTAKNASAPLDQKTKTKVKETAQDIEDPELRDALEKLGEQLYAAPKTNF